MGLDWPSGVNWMAGGAIAALLIPGLVIGFAVPYWVSLVIALLAGGGAVVLLAPRARFEGIDVSSIGRGRIELARELLGDAEPLVARLQAAATSIRAEAVKERVGHLVQCARGILDVIENDPLKIEPARRFLTYYLPRAVEMAEGYRMLEQMKLPDAERLRATRDLLDRLDTAFAKYADGLLVADLSTLDIELKLLKGSLDDDLGPLAGKPTTAAPALPKGRA
jgi:5-bromo-4-chloroindolyl phosphate hydrolysis protein